MSTTEHESGTPEGVTRQEFSELAGAVRELRDALEEQRKASTPKEKEEARAEVREAKADLNTLAKELGIDPKRLESAANEARKQQQKEELRPLLIELLDEELAPDPDDDGGEGDPKPEGEPKPEPKPDSEPRQEHWSDKPLSELFK